MEANSAMHVDKEVGGDVTEVPRSGRVRKEEGGRGRKYKKLKRGRARAEGSNANLVGTKRAMEENEGKNVS